MKTKLIVGSIVLLTVIFITACENNSVSPAILPSSCDTTDLTYTNTMQIVININCGTMNTGCHSSGTNHDFSTYASMQKYVTGGQDSRFWQQLFILKKMPLYPELALDICTSNQFKVWLLNGAPQ